MKPLFQEKQRFTQWWLWVIVVACALLVLAIFGNALYTQMVLGKPWGDEPVSDDSLVMMSLLSATVVIVMLMIFFNSMLEIVVDKTSVTYRYFPLIRSWKRIERENIQAFEQRTNYWKGYGIHRDLRGNKTLNVKGHQVVEITMMDGSKLTLGTQIPGEFLGALEKMKNRRED